MEKITFETDLPKPIEKMEKAADKITNLQKKYNVSQKKIAYIIGKNLILFVCMLVPCLLIGSVWVDFGEVVFHTKMIAEGFVMVMLLAVGESLMSRLGSEGGKMDSDYLEAKTVFDNLVNKVGEIGTLLLDIFCDWQIDVEMEQAIRVRQRMLHMTPKMWEEAKQLSKSELIGKYGERKAEEIHHTMNLKPIELNSAILLYDGEYTERGDIPESAEAYIAKKSHLITVALSWIFGGLLSITVALLLTDDVTFARVMYTAFKLIFLLFRMAVGYDRSARAYNTVEVRRIRAKSNYLRQYIKFVEDKIYLKLGDKYGDVSQFVGEEIVEVENG